MNSVPLRRALTLAVVAAAGVAGVVAWRAWKRPAPPPLSLSYWYWHRPFRLADDERKALVGAGVRELFIHAGTLSVGDDGNLRTSLRQQWGEGGKGFQIHLVVNASGGVLAKLASLEPAAVAEAVAATVREARDGARAKGLEVVGVQTDFDYPSRLLLRYAAMLDALRAKLPGLTLSAALLATYYTRRELDAVLQRLDFAAPQFYEAQTSRRLDDFAPVSDPKRLARGLAAAGRRGFPFRAGLPAYGHALVFDGAGRLRGVYRDASADTLAGDTRFRLEKREVEPRSGERVLTFVASGTDRPDHRVVYDLPTPDSLARCLATLREKRPDNCAGAILFRLPERGESATLPLPTSLALWRGEAPAPSVRVRIRKGVARPWSAVEGGTPAGEVFVDVTNDGAAGTAIGPESVVVDVRLGRPGVESVAPGGFARATPFLGEPGRAGSPARADGVRFSAAGLPAGATLTAGPLRLTDAVVPSVVVEWRALSADGATTLSGKGSLP